MSRVIIVIQEKGGCFKSFLAVHLVTYLRKHGHIFVPVDLDQTPGVMSKVFPGADSASVDPNSRLLLSGESALPRLMEKAFSRNLCIDCGANTSDGWDILLSDICPDLLEEFSRKGVKITLVIPVTKDSKTTDWFERYGVLFPGATRIMCVVKQYAAEQFPTPAHPPEKTIRFPQPPSALFGHYLTTSRSLDSLATEESKTSGAFDPRGYARGYLVQLHGQFDQIKSDLHP
jgi:hypothetical protein